MPTRSHLQHPERLQAQAAIFNLGNLVRNGTLPAGDILGHLPGSVMIQDFGSMTNTYMNPQGCAILRRSKEELQELGPAYFELFFLQEEIAVLKPALQQLIVQQDCTRLFSFLQRVRPGTQADYQWYLTSSRLYQRAGKPPGEELLHIAVAVGDARYAARKIHDIGGQNLYVEQHYAQYNLLTCREKEIIQLITKGYSTYCISERLFISQHTVNCHRKHIIAKLEVKGLAELIRFALAFQLYTP